MTHYPNGTGGLTDIPNMDDALPNFATEYQIILQGSAIKLKRINI
jgi:hypothetical protein